MEIDRPIFIVAPHRSGTTLLVNLLARHDRVASFTKVHHRMAWWPSGAARLDAWCSRHIPHEAQHVWDRFRPRDSEDTATAADATDAQRRFFRSMIGHAVAARGAARFVAKYTRSVLR